MNDHPWGYTQLLAERDAKKHDRFAVIDIYGGYEYTRTQEEAEAIRSDIPDDGPAVRVVELRGDD